MTKLHLSISSSDPSQKEYKFRIAAVLFSAVFLLSGLLFLDRLLLPKWLDDPLWEPATEIVTGFYEEERDSLDVLFLGSSHVFCGVNPLRVYEESGLTSYDLSSGLQRTWMSYYYLEEALKTQKPQVVVLDTAGLFMDTQNEESRNRMAIDYMRPSMTKWKAAAASRQPGESMVSYVFPSIRFHARILDLEKSDFTWLFRKDRHHYLHGYRFAYMDKVTPVTFLDVKSMAYNGRGIGPDSGTEVLWPEGSKSKEYLCRISELCRQKGIRLMLVTIPVTKAWDPERHELVRQFAEESGAEYMDFVGREAEIGLDPESDFYDASHLNIDGAHLFSGFLGRLLREQYFPGKPEENRQRHSPAAEEQWKQDLRRYYENYSIRNALP